MKVLNLKIKNIKCFKEIEIPFEDNEKIKDWSLIVGDNGQGKTTILRSLALGLCDESGASGLPLELHGGILRDKEESGFIEVTLKDENENKKYQIKTKINLKGSSESVSQKTYQLESKNESSKELSADKLSSIRDKFFVIGYGSGRSITGTESYEEYAVVDSIYTLFKYTEPLQTAELGAWRIKSKSEKEFSKLKNCLKKILMLKDSDEITLSPAGLRIKTDQWGDRPFNSLSDGYLSLTTVIVDFLSWKLLHDSNNFDLRNTSGIFIIDEIEQHLHPRWQRKIIKILSEQFPNMQFICSTHTPICTLGLYDLECKSQLIKASYKNSHSETEIFDMKEQYKGYRIDQILTSDIFDLSSSRSINIEEKLKEYRRIYLKDSDKRSSTEKEKLKNIEEELKHLPMWETLENEEIKKQLIKLIDQQGA